MLRAIEEGAIQTGPSSYNLTALFSPLFIYHQPVSLITVVIISTQNLYLSSHLCDPVHPALPDLHSTMGLWGGIFPCRRSSLHASTIYVQYPDGRFYKYKDLCCWSKGECPGQPQQHIVILQQQDPLKLEHDLNHHIKHQPENYPIPRLTVNEDKPLAFGEPPAILYVEENRPEPAETALEEPIADWETIPDEEQVLDGEDTPGGGPSFSHSPIPYITEGARVR
ncbi:unnamed protein product [Aureobasidium mustum]|uniref:Uncharacterized protein n=1 Tax=Aureobasidium mustum TaxID=2773714 RepID=A0A9N8P9Y9_9PEZI|nr:unnamed protein product [Aureobasidium mustum]